IKKKLNKKLSLEFYKRNDKIGGNNIVVEIDESKFEKRKYHRGHRLDSVWVFGAVERTDQRKIFLIPVEFRNQYHLIPILQRYIHSESIIYSDCWEAYNNLNKIFKEHLTVNHSMGFINTETDVHTNTIEVNWCSVKQQTPIRC
ncbi:hypothetical protein EDEG_00689, partial [Edhazardia aedis USNM 41457]